MKPSLRALEKNILKYRALQMLLLLHQAESLRSTVIGSIRSTDKVHGDDRLPMNSKRPMEKALAIIVKDNIITEKESKDLQSIIAVRDTIAHRVHELVSDISAPRSLRHHDTIYDYFALDRFEQYRDKIFSGMSGRYVIQLSLRELQFEQAEATYKEELTRLRRRINRQHNDRRAAA